MNPNNVLLAGTILPSICCVVSFTIFCLSAYTFKTTTFKVGAAVGGKNHAAGDNSTQYLQKKSVLMIVVCAFFSCITSAGVLTMHIWSYQGVDPNNTYYCVTAVPKMYSTTYILGNTALYQFLNARSECVRTSADSLKAFKNLRRMTKLLANLVPIIAILTLALWAGELVEVDGKYHCVDAPTWQLATSFSVLAAVISVFFLTLFIWPLKVHYTMMKKSSTNQIKSTDSDSTKPLLSVIKKNLILSCIAITSTAFSMIFLSILGTNPHIERYALNLSVTFGQADLCVNLCCMALMTTTWLPPTLRKKKRAPSTSIVISKGNLISSNNETKERQTRAQSTASFQQ